jgi:hypothetical protein
MGTSGCISILPTATLVLVLGMTSASLAVQMRLTMYDDGRLCPGDCDAHVVLHENNNGTVNASLLPAACRDGTFVGRDGLDCCSGSVLHDGPLGTECRDFYPDQ